MQILKLELLLNTNNEKNEASDTIYSFSATTKTT
jgi:hypothetical protein